MKINTVYGFEEVMTKKCIYCNEEKPLDQFPKRESNLDGFDTRCRNCKTSRGRLVKNLRKKSKPMTEVCECCGKKPNFGSDADVTRRIRRLVLDHDNKTGFFRGWLCTDCNTAIGALGDNLEGLQKAVDYLKRNT